MLDFLQGLAYGLWAAGAWFMIGMFDPRLALPAEVARRLQVFLRYGVAAPFIGTLLFMTSLWGGFGASLGGWLAGLVAVRSIPIDTCEVHEHIGALTINDPVKAALEQWLTQYRPNLMTAYVNYEFMRYRMWPEYHQAGLPEALLFGMLAKESGGRVHAVSRAGASGPLQFMYATGLRFGLSARDGFDQRFDPALSARANAAYINEQLVIFNGNLELVIAAYNGGEGRIRRLAARGGSTSFWDPAVYSILPDETRDYVPMVLAAAWLFLHPERYNLEFPKVDGKPGSIQLAKPASLAELSVCFGSEGGMYDGWFRTLRNLNPAIDPQSQLPEGTRLEVPVVLETAYEGLCAGGQWAQLAGELNAATRATRPARPSASSRSTASSYTVRRGDNLAAIARRSGCKHLREIAELNGIRGPQYRIRAGQRLRMPACSRR